MFCFVVVAVFYADILLLTLIPFVPLMASQFNQSITQPEMSYQHEDAHAPGQAVLLSISSHPAEYTLI